VVLNGIVDPHPRFNTITLILNSVIIYFYTYVMLPKLGLLDSFKYQN
jgi:hypothetical protein